MMNQEELKPVIWSIDNRRGLYTKTHWLKPDGFTLCGHGTNNLPSWRKPFKAIENLSRVCKSCERIKGKNDQAT